MRGHSNAPFLEATQELPFSISRESCDDNASQIFLVP